MPARSLRDQDFGDVEQYLREGKSVVMFLDSKDVIGPGYEAFAGSDETEDTDADRVDHFVRVIGIDREAGVAIIANSGQYNGSQVEVPLERLEEAWDDNTNREGFAADRAHVLGCRTAPIRRPTTAASPRRSPPRNRSRSPSRRARPAADAGPDADA